MPRSPSVWRVWIEISDCGNGGRSDQSPSVWRVWIEMNGCFNTFEPKICHPPCGGCGLKLFWFQRCSFFDMSPSVWRVWIEIQKKKSQVLILVRHPPCGGCGLKSLFRGGGS